MRRYIDTDRVPAKQSVCTFMIVSGRVHLHVVKCTAGKHETYSEVLGETYKTYDIIKYNIIGSYVTFSLQSRGLVYDIHVHVCYY